MRLRTVLVVLVGAAYVAGCHWLMTSAPGSRWNAVIVIGPMLGLLALFTARLNKAFVDALASNEMKARLASLFAEAMAGPPERFAAFVKSELGKYEKVVKASGARIE